MHLCTKRDTVCTWPLLTVGHSDTPLCTGPDWNRQAVSKIKPPSGVSARVPAGWLSSSPRGCPLHLCTKRATVCTWPLLRVGHPVTPLCTGPDRWLAKPNLLLRESLQAGFLPVEEGLPQAAAQTETEGGPFWEIIFAGSKNKSGTTNHRQKNFFWGGGGGEMLPFPYLPVPQARAHPGQAGLPCPTAHPSHFFGFRQSPNTGIDFEIFHLATSKRS